MVFDKDWPTEVASAPVVSIPPPLARDLEAFKRCLRQDGLRGALTHLNLRTPHRFTGVFRFDGDTLRSVALVDKWDANVERGEDAPVARAYCAHLRSTGQPLGVEDGDIDPRTPWMRGSGIASYCGAVIRNKLGAPWGALCHYDAGRCESKDSDMPLLVAAAALLYEVASHEGVALHAGTGAT